MGKKNLEQLYRDSFENYSEVPDPMVWQNIEATLDNRKEKKRVIPIWWRLGGVAALLAIMFYVFNPFGNPPPNNTNQEVITNTDNNEKPDSNEESTQDSLQLDNPTQLATEDEPVEIQGNEDALKISPAQNELVQQERASDNAVNPKRLSKSSSQVVEQNNSKENLEKDKKDVLLEKQMKINEDAVAVATNEKDKNLQESKTDPAKQDALLESQIKSDKDAVAMQTVEKDKTVPTESNTDPTKRDATKESFAEINKTKDAVAENNTIESKEKVDETKANEKQSIFDAIAEQQKEADDDFVVVADNGEGKWSVGPSIAPIFFGSNGEGSPIHSEFQGASKTGNVNLSYGLTVAYNIGKRLKIRSGVHRVDFGYDTNDVEFSSSVSSSTNAQIDNISYNSTSRNLVLRNSRNALPEGPATTADVFSEETSVFDGRMIQQFGYIEVPFELDYALVDKKFGVNVIGGISSLFLVDNSIQLESPSQNLLTEMGEANNANSVNFSTNIGLGFNYDFSPKLQFNLEPVFKYQLNTFSETAGTFRPYSVGIYSGIRFNF
ncbi:MAG: hypothetical protein AAGL34_02700 [Bacteroidota bacterium]